MPPIDVRGMKILDRSKFSKVVTLPVMRVKENRLPLIIKFIKPYLLKMENFKPVQLDDAEYKDKKQTVGKQYATKCIYLDPNKAGKWTHFSEGDRDSLASLEISENDFYTKSVELTYENWRSDDIFKSVLPVNEEHCSSFSQIGHIVHVNLRDHLLDYKNIIGEVLLDKLPNCKTVVNKCNVINNTYRNFSMEVLAGEKDFLVSVKENKCVFTFDFSTVYWNSRLCKEHERIIAFVKTGDILFDIFAGVGPFSIPIAKKKCTVFANDLNPESYKWLNYNVQKNKVNLDFFKSYNMDGKDFIRDVILTFLKKIIVEDKDMGDKKIHVTMNLPAMAVEFLNVFNGGLKELAEGYRVKHKPIVHVYCFAGGNNHKKIAQDMVESNIGCSIDENLIEILDVRNVSPQKEMMRVTFTLSESMLFGKLPCNNSKKRSAEDDIDVSPKKTAL